MATANATLKLAIANGYDGLSPRDVMLCILQGASSAGSGFTYVQNFGGANPGTVLAVAPVGNAIAMDTGTGAVWGYNGSVWTQFIA
jgi:hypothetical protein